MFKVTDEVLIESCFIISDHAEIKPGKIDKVCVENNLIVNIDVRLANKFEQLLMWLHIIPSSRYMLGPRKPSEPFQTNCDCLICSGYCACGIPGHHDKPSKDIES